MSDRLLLHVCCGPCATATYRYWRSEGAEVQGFFYNPNIHPLLEYRRRLEGARDLAAQMKMPLTEDLWYDPQEWFTLVADDPMSRCAACIGVRMERAAREAAAQGCEAFSTSLSISPWQDHEAIRVRGRGAGERFGVEFIYRDLRSLYGDSRRLSREWGLYRQKYCGCLVSEAERYRDAKKS